MSWPILALLLVIALLVLAIAFVAVARRRQRAAPVTPPPLPHFPIVLVHGFLGFGEIRFLGRPFRYFRGVAEAMAEAGATVHIVTLPAAASVEERARVLAEAVRALSAPRVHLVAHSMGGIDARYAIARLGLADRVASLVTIGTPHQGTPLARLASLRPVAGLRRVVTRVGYRTDAVEWLTPERMARFNEECPDHPEVYYACVVGSSRWRISNPGLWSGHVLMGRAAGISDGVVPVTSQRWGEVIAELDADHWAQIGWAVGVDVRPLYRDIALALRAREPALAIAAQTSTKSDTKTDTRPGRRERRKQSRARSGKTASPRVT
jgi:triacylglycerol lipase